MHQDIALIAKSALNLAEVLEQTLLVFEKSRLTGAERIGYVSGIVSSDGVEKIPENMRILHAHTLRIRQVQSFPVFSAADLFSQELLLSLPEMQLPHAEHKHLFIGFWRDVLSAGYVTDVFLTPRWENSEGARDEYRIAQKIGLRIHEVPLL